MQKYVNNVCISSLRAGHIHATDFRGRSTEIARAVSWSSDSQDIWAAIAETSTDVVLFDGLD